ncbi:MAG TPA: dihydrofolate reductase family protein [Candidatus Dormibacteraeota bacterium]|nr:dihydrofolate reductase family protein [Candidatus Dormibacteraeota bacterium]
MPADLKQIYGRLGFSDQVVYSNFVTSLDGVVALGSTPNAGSMISGRNRADRFLMGLLRACADAVLVGAGTLRATPGHLWTAEHIFPDLKDQFGELRRQLGREPQPHLVVLTKSGNVDRSHPAMIAGASLASDVQDALTDLRRRGLNVVLTEGGPNVMGELIKRSLVDEAFVTTSPVIAGRAREARLGMVQGVELLPGHGVWSRLLSARRHGDYLFLRYDLRSSARP